MNVWKQHELWDGTYSLDDLLDVHEMLSIDKTNENIMYEIERAKGEQQR